MGQAYQCSGLPAVPDRAWIQYRQVSSSNVATEKCDQHKIGCGSKIVFAVLLRSRMAGPSSILEILSPQAPVKTYIHKSPIFPFIICSIQELNTFKVQLRLSLAHTSLSPGDFAGIGFQLLVSRDWGSLGGRLSQ